jgi:hypothetical protein
LRDFFNFGVQPIPVEWLRAGKTLFPAANGTTDLHIALHRARYGFRDLAGALAIQALGDVASAKTTVAGHRLRWIVVGADVAL